jgi:photosystem II stability/assembly factor-like uncharacterized protein
LDTALLATPVAQSLLEGSPFRCIGPPRGGRSVAAAGDPSDPAVFYFGAVAGGVWKTEDAGTTWLNVSDGFFATSSVGALAVSESDPSVIYAGMGESTIRIDVSHGDGVYRSGDGGQTWKHCGLSDTRHIGEVRIHPKDPNRVYVAALGHAFGPNEERGLFRTTDGGATWENVLHVGPEAGAVDVSFDPRSPDVIYATTWQTHRNFWELSSGGPHSGLWKSTDGGDSWTEISHNKGLPAEGTILGKIGVSASPVKAGRVWALVEAAENPGLYRSEDFGDTWKLVSKSQDLRYRAWYYMHVFADTQDADTVYINNLDMWKSTDGGSTFTKIPTPHGDNHDLWIDPNNHRRMIQTNDGGANVSFNGGESWSTIYNQLTAQLYTVTTDNREPYYYVYGTQQDNSSIAVPSSTADGAIGWSDCFPAGTGESGFMAVHPENPNIVYVGAVGSSPGGGGALQRYDHSTGQIQLVNVWPEHHGGIGPGELTYRFPWTYPILFSPHDPNILYAAGNHVFRSTNEGHSWEPISPDLSRNDPEKLNASGGPISKDTSGAEHYCTVATFRESDHEPGVFWAGSDDGLVHISRDNGASWQDVTPPDLPEWSFIRTVEPSPHDAATAYVAATRYKLDDPAPYLYKTTDYGQTWHDITGHGDHAMPEDDFVRVIRTDPARPGLLFVGTETGLYVSTDDGAGWHRWQSNLPVTPIYDIEVKENDLVLATHGRSFWLLDDLTPLHQLIEAKADDSIQLFTPRSAWRMLPDLFWQWISTEGKDYWLSLGKHTTFISEKTETGHVQRTMLDAGQGAPVGVTIAYALDPEFVDDETQSISLAFLDAAGNLVREFHPKPAGYADLGDNEKAMDPGPWIPVKPGVNRFLWNLRYAGSDRVLGNKLAGEADVGPIVLPGTYTVELRLNGAAGAGTLSETFEVINDPRSPVGEADLEQQLVVLLQIRDKISELHNGITRLRSVRSQVKTWSERLADGSDAANSATSITEALDAIEDVLIVPGDHTDTFGLNERARLNEKLASVISVMASADAKPTQQAMEVAAGYTEEIDAQLARLSSVLDDDVPAFNALVKQLDLPAVE